MCQQRLARARCEKTTGIQLDFLFAYEVFSLGLFFPVFFLFLSALRVEKKKPQKSARAP
jgi:hypothetical protein